jgi:hypothetical protein
MINQLLNVLKNWEFSEEESCSDHNIIKFNLGQDTYHGIEKITTDTST